MFLSRLEIVDIYNISLAALSIFLVFYVFIIILIKVSDSSTTIMWIYPVLLLLAGEIFVVNSLTLSCFSSPRHDHMLHNVLLKKSRE